MEGKDFEIRVVSETPTGDGFVDCVWEMPAWLANRLESDARKHGVTMSELVTGIFRAALEKDSAR